jgi:hypothetical protein
MRLPHHLYQSGDARIIQANLFTARRCIPAQIEGVGPRYCPSIEDKVVRFADKTRHQIFLEPEGLDDDTVYPNGISTSLPEDVQHAFLAQIAGSWRRRALSGRAMPSSTITSIRANCARPGNPPFARAVPRRPDQRHDGIRGSRRPGADGRSERGPRGRGRQRRRSRWTGPMPISG